MKKVIRQMLLSASVLLGLPMVATAQDATVAWTFDEGATSATSAVVSIENAVSASSYSLGPNLSIVGTETASPEVLTKLQPGTAVGRDATDAQTYIEFAFTPKRGMTFAPSKFSFNATKCGTSGGYFDTYVIAGTDTLLVTKAFNPNRSNDKTGPKYSAMEYDISKLSATSSTVKVIFYVYNLAANKQVGLSDITFAGTFSGSAQDVPSYTLDVKQGMEGAGSIAVLPAGNKLDEGTTVTISASENFGYHFAGWLDAEGNVVSTENPYSFAISQNTTIEASYTKKNVYALNLTLTDGARSNLVTVAPEGNVVDGIHHYEEGTTVVLTATNNKILTFVGWEDNSTSSERSIDMTEEKNVTANFSAADYIVGWDLYDDEPGSERAADYKADTENAGLLSLHNAAGTTTSWLACGHTKGMQNGRYGARVWKSMASQNYFEISFSTKGYSNIKVSNALGDDYNAYSTMIEQYSVDGKNYKEVGRFNLPSRSWNEQEFSLPADANEQDRVYVRWMADSTSEKTGVASDYDGTTIGDIFVLADAASSSDAVAPQLVSSNPENNATGVSATGSVVLNFDEKVKLGNGDITLDGETLTPVVSGKTVVCKYSGLKYSTNYTVTIPRGAITDRNGNEYEGTAIHFTTMERTQPKSRLYDAVVAADGTGDYTSLQDAIDAAPDNSATPWLIFVKKGTYTGHFTIKSSKTNLHIIGQGKDLVTISDNRTSGSGQYGITDGATMDVEGSNIYFEGFDLINSWGVEKNNGPQALALCSNGDKLVMNKIGLRSYQDTWYTGGTTDHRSYITDSWIEGAVDFFYGKGDVMITQDTINIVRKSGGYIVAPNHPVGTKWGYVFLNDVITAPGVPSETSVWLGRPWHEAPKTVFINTKAEVTIPATGWYPTMGGLPALWAEYNTMDADGNPVDLSQRRTDYYYETKDADGNVTGRVEGKSETAVLTAEQAAQYTVKNVCGGDDSWNPELLCEACEAPVVTISDNKLSWSAVPYAICYVVSLGDEVIGFTKETGFDLSSLASSKSAAAYKVQAVNEYGGLSACGVATVASVICSIEAESAADMAMYNLAGQKVDGSYKGVAIMKGKKIVK